MAGLLTRRPLPPAVPVASLAPLAPRRGFRPQALLPPALTLALLIRCASTAAHAALDGRRLHFADGRLRDQRGRSGGIFIARHFSRPCPAGSTPRVRP